MAARLMLRGQLEEAWRRTIAQEYADQLINSERGLQVFLCKHLLDCFESDKVSRRLFIEPRVSMPGSDDPKFARHPDIVICHTRKIIGIVEIKYLPRARAKFKKDLLTLDWLLEGQVDVSLSSDRYGAREMFTPDIRWLAMQFIAGQASIVNLRQRLLCLTPEQLMSVFS